MADCKDFPLPSEQRMLSVNTLETTKSSATSTSNEHREKAEETVHPAVRRLQNASQGDGEIQATPEIDVQRADPMFNQHAGENTIEYKNMNWLHAVVIMIAETISLGILSLPSAIATLGLAGGCTLIVTLGMLACYTGYEYGRFKLRHPSVVTMADAGYILAGKVGREVLGWASTCVLIFIMAAHVTSFGVMMNVLTEHSSCTIAWYVIGTVISALACMPRTMKAISYLSISSCISVIVAVIVAMVAIGVTSRHPGQVKVVEQNSVTHAMIPVLNIIIAFAGHVAFFNIQSEMRRPQDFSKAICLLQAVATSFYLLCAVVIYWFAGHHVPSPALSAAPPLIRKIAYGIASLTIIIAGVVNGHIAVKFCYLRLWEYKGVHEVIFEKSWRARGSWWVLSVGAWVLAWLLAEAIPSFNHILALVSALFCGWFSYGLSGFFWFSMNKGKLTEGWKQRGLLVLNVLVIACGVAICGLGLVSTGKAIASGESGAPFSCADNSVVVPGSGAAH